MATEISSVAMSVTVRMPDASEWDIDVNALTSVHVAKNSVLQCCGLDRDKLLAWVLVLKNTGGESGYVQLQDRQCVLDFWAGADREKYLHMRLERLPAEQGFGNVGRRARAMILAQAYEEYMNQPVCERLAYVVKIAATGMCARGVPLPKAGTDMTTADFVHDPALLQQFVPVVAIKVHGLDVVANAIANQFQTRPPDRRPEIATGRCFAFLQSTTFYGKFWWIGKVSTLAECRGKNPISRKDFVNFCHLVRNQGQTVGDRLRTMFWRRRDLPPFPIKNLKKDCIIAVDRNCLQLYQVECASGATFCRDFAFDRKHPQRIMYSDAALDVLQLIVSQGYGSELSATDLPWVVTITTAAAGQISQTVKKMTKL